MGASGSGAGSPRNPLAHDTFGTRAKKSTRQREQGQFTNGHPQAAAWVDETLRNFMTLAREAGRQMLMPYYLSVVFSPPPTAREYAKELIFTKSKSTTWAASSSARTRGPLGIERSQVYPTAELTNELQRRAKIPLVIGADFEVRRRA